MTFHFLSAKKDETKHEVAVENLSFKDIPGITPGEISAIEDLQKKHSYFVYGINPTTEAFIGKDSGINGYAVMFCNWLSDMFGIEFKPAYYQWGDLLRGLEAGEIDFTGELMATTEAKPGYTMSSPTINRTLKYYRIHRSVPLEEIQRVRNLRFAFLTEAVVAADVDANSPYTFDIVLVDSHPEAYRLLKSGQVDAFFGLETAEGAFDQYGDVDNETFYPLIFRSSCLSTHNDGFRAIVNVLDKAMDERVLEYLTAMQKRGRQQYLENKLDSKLTEEERAFIKNNHFIPIAGDFSNYPISFYDTRENKWDGIYFEVLGEVEKLTGLKFQVANETDTPLLNLIDNIEKGQALILPELFKINEYEGRFLWSDIPIINDNFAFLSLTDFRNIDANDVFHLKVGLRKHTIYSELFKTIFPAHRNITEYVTQEETWDALQKGEIDVIFASRRRLLIFTNYYEEAGFKLNFVLNHTFNSYFAYNKDAVILKTIVDKALNVIDLQKISLQWMYKTYDYRNKMAAAQRPWLIGASILFFVVLLLVTYLFLKSRSAGKELEEQVKQRTGDLAFETSKLQAVLASIPDMLFTKDKGFKYTQCNHAFEKFMGVHEKDILGKTDKDGAWLFPEHAEMISKIERTVIQENKVQYIEEKICSPATGADTIFETVKAPIIQEGTVVGLVAVIRDITKRKEMEKDLSLQTSLFKTMLGSLPDVVFCKNLNFKYTLCNNNMAEIFGKKVEDILGRDDVSGLGLPPETAAIANETDLKVMNEGQRTTYEEWVPGADGVTRLYETVKSPLMLDGEVIGVMAIARDITKRKEMEEEAMAANRAKSSFLANMSHELRTPLNVIIGLTDLILEDDMSEHLRTNLLKITNAGSTLLSIVNDILDFSKIESGKLVLSPVEYYVSSILNDLITLVLTRLGEKPIKFKLNIKDDLPNKLFGDDLRVKQILTNLLTNAVKYTREGTIELSMRCTREGGTVWLDAAVSDSGMGIPKEDIKNLFLDYYQVATNANRNIEGTGLGLPITKRLIEMMDGEIDVESEHGKGSTFHFRIKQGFVNDMPLGAEVSEKLRSFSYSDDKRITSRKLVRVNLSYAKVLVIDDMQTNLDVASGILKKYQMQVDVLSNGPAAIDRIRGGTPVYNAIFMDHMMPGMDGIETADNIRALGTEYAKNVPIIALTANAIQGTDKMFYAHGFQDFITKPIDVMEMDTVLRKWIYDSKHRDAGVSGGGTSAEDVSTEDAAAIDIKIPGVDTKKGLSLYAGEVDIYLPLLRSYIANTPTTLSKLKAVTAETLGDYVITVHGLKGTSAGIGAEDIREKALELEQISRAGDLQGVLLKNDKLIADTEVIVANVTAWLKDYDSKNAKPRRKAPDRKLLEKLRQCCENYDMSGIDEAMTELDKYYYDEDSALIAWLKEKVVISEIGEVAQRLAK
jgi:PAS domain S-box-containing protein